MSRPRLQKFHRELIHALEGNGIEVEPETRKRHLLFRLSRGRRRAKMIVSGSPSDHHAKDNAVKLAEKLLEGRQ